MESNLHGNIYRVQQDNLRIIQDFGKRPPEPVRQNIRNKLEAQRKKFKQLENIREQREQRKRGMSY